MRYGQRFDARTRNLCQKEFTGTWFTWLERCDELAASALEKAVAVFVRGNAAAIITAITHHVARDLGERKQPKGKKPSGCSRDQSLQSEIAFGAAFGAGLRVFSGCSSVPKGRPFVDIDARAHHGPGHRRRTARNYDWVHSTAYPNTFTHEVSDEYSSSWHGPMLHDSVNVYTEALEKNGKLHKAMTRLTVGFTVDCGGHMAIYSLTLKVL